MKNYYINFVPEAKVNYFYLFSLIELADYRAETKAFDTIKYQSVSKLAEMLMLSPSTVRRIMQGDEYKLFLSVDTKEKEIILNNSVIKGSNNNRFVCLSDKEVSFLRKYNDNLLVKYYLYLKYYCGFAAKANIKQDFTAKQFLSAIGYSVKSNSQIDTISSYNQLLANNGFIKIDKYTDELGHTRNIYSLMSL